MVQLICIDRKLVILKNQAQGLFIKLLEMNAIRQAGPWYLETGQDKGLDANRAIDGDIGLFIVGLERTASQKAWQTKNMVPMQMGDENLWNLAGANGCFQNPILCSFATVKKPDFIEFVQQFEGQTGYIAGLGGLTSPRP